MPAYLAEKIRTTRDTLAGERKQVTVLFTDIKDSTDKTYYAQLRLDLRSALWPLGELERTIVYLQDAAALADATLPSAVPSPTGEILPRKGYGLPSPPIIPTAVSWRI
jgi:hypothetical protein